MCMCNATDERLMCNMTLMISMRRYKFLNFEGMLIKCKIERKITDTGMDSEPKDFYFELNLKTQSCIHLTRHVGCFGCMAGSTKET